MHCDFARLFASVPMLVCCFCVLRLLLPFPLPDAAALPLAYALDFLAVSVVTYLSLVTIVRWVRQKNVLCFLHVSFLSKSDK